MATAVKPVSRKMVFLNTFIAVLLAILAFAAAEGEGLCDLRFEWQYNDSCYTITNSRGSEQNCEETNAKLVEIESEEENEFLKARLRDFWVKYEAYEKEDPSPSFFSMRKMAYIGARQELGSSVWEWARSGAEVSVTDWAPDAWPAYMMVPQAKCAVMSHSYDESWEEYACESPNVFSLCEAPTGFPQERCVKDVCYKLLPMLGSHDNSEARCSHYGSGVAHLRSQEEMNFVEDFLNEATFREPQVKGKASVWVKKVDDSYFGTCMVLDAANDWKKKEVPCASTNAVLCKTSPYDPFHS